MTSPSAFSPTRFDVTRHSDTFWRVTFDHGPLNLIDGQMNLELHQLLDEIEQDARVAVVLFDSGNAD
jgi:enoyl-CoA hydratase/carnithine racemase